MKLAKYLVLTVCAAFLIVTVWLGVFPPNTPRVFLNQRRAVESIRSINIAQREYSARHPDDGFACHLSDLNRLGAEPSSGVGLLDPVLASGTKSFYHFEIQCSQQGSQKATNYIITALPEEQRTTGEYAFCSDQTGEVWYSASGLATDCLKTRKPIEQKYR